ncbi:serine/threonine-protein kinase [Streptomyces xanthophaeus]|uniref:serine/threonine-protein kinase n=1 Tax=Streptomyces xanthophaeus TaxID=67385 RepID=UPI00398FDF9A
MRRIEGADVMNGTNNASDHGAGHTALRPLAAGDPREISGYGLLARIGEGGMGSVYLSRTRGSRPVALKMIRREYAGDPEFRLRFEQEVQAAQQVRGYHLVPVLDYDTQAEQPWLATAYVPGLPLDQALDAFGPLPLPAALQLVACVARALESVHAVGIVHRDLKPGNIMLAADGPWVIDFGIARAAENTRLTRSGSFIGTPQFMSPEQGVGGDLTAASDVFSLGLIAAVAATGRHPYGEGSALTVATQIANTAQRPPDLSGYPDWLRPLLEGALAADPAARPEPGELARLCERSAGRGAADLAGWLPEPWASAVAAREAELERLPAAGAAGSAAAGPPPAHAPAYAATYVPTQAPGAIPGSGVPPVHSAPTQAPAQPPLFPPAPPAAASGTSGGRGNRGRVLVAAAVALVAAIGGAAWAVSGGLGSGDDGKGRTRAEQPQEQPKQDQSKPESPQQPAQPSGQPSAQPSASKPAQGGSYEVLFQDKPLLIEPPAGSIITVDLDAPRVLPSGDNSDKDVEFYYILQNMRFRKAMAKSPGTTPEVCRQAVDTGPLPAELSSTALIKDDAIAAGDVLCSVTSKGNLAMLQITEVKPTGRPYDPPGYAGKLTLWKQPPGAKP